MRMAADTSVTDALRAAILRGDYAPRQRMIEADLCAELGVSRFAVRTTLRALAAEGLIEVQPNKGARIREIPLAEAIEITEVRMVLEGLVAARAAARGAGRGTAPLQRAQRRAARRHPRCR